MDIETNENLSKALNFKERGNEELKKGNNEKAVYYYTEAIKINPNDAIFYSNRAAAYINLDKFENALSDAHFALQLNKTFLKAYYRKAAALYELDRLEEAKQIINESFQIGSFEEMQKLSEKIHEEWKKDNALPVSHPEIMKIKALESWLSEGDSAFDSFKIRYYSENYRGVHAKKAIHKNETILFIPKKFLITLEMAQKTEISMKILQNNVELLSPKHSILSTFILREKRDPNSYWRPYIELLPTNYSSMPIFFDEEDLKWLEGSPFLNQVFDKQADMKKDYEAIKEVASEIEEYGLNEFCWARMTASSRIFGIVIDNVKTDAFVPYADMLNHKRPKQTNWSYSDEKQGFIIESNENIQKGEPVYDSYGRKCNSRFLLNYGFIVEGNDANEVAVKVSFVEGDPLLKTKESLMNQKIHSKNFRISANLEESASRDFFGFVRFVVLDNEKLLNVLKDSKVRQMSEDSEEEQSNSAYKPQNTPPLTIKIEETALLYIKKLCLESLNKYPTTLNEDLEILKRENLTLNQRNCVLLRSGEKEILHFFVKMAEKLIPLLSRPVMEIRKISLEQEYQIYSFYINNTILPLKREKNS